MGAIVEVHIDSDHMAQGYHDGASGASVLRDMGADFKSCGITVGVAIYNVSDGSNGLVTAVTEDTIACTLTGGSNNTWAKGDLYRIYHTATKDSTISYIYTDKRFGQKCTKKAELIDGIFLADIDEDDMEFDKYRPGEDTGTYITTEAGKYLTTEFDDYIMEE